MNACCRDERGRTCVDGSVFNVQGMQLEGLKYEGSLPSYVELSTSMVDSGLRSDVSDVDREGV